MTIIGHCYNLDATSSGQDILRESFSFDLPVSSSCELLLFKPGLFVSSTSCELLLFVSTSWEALLLIPANNSFPKADLFLLVDGSDAELLKRRFLLRGLVPLPEGGGIFYRLEI